MFSLTRIRDVKDAQRSSLVGLGRCGVRSKTPASAGHYGRFKYKGVSTVIPAIVEIEPGLMLKLKAPLFVIVFATYDYERCQKPNDDVISL